MVLFCYASLKTKIVVLDGKKIPKPVDVTELATRSCVGPMPSQLVRPMVELCLWFKMQQNLHSLKVQ